MSEQQFCDVVWAFESDEYASTPLHMLQDTILSPCTLREIHTLGALTEQYADQNLVNDLAMAFVRAVRSSGCGFSNNLVRELRSIQRETDGPPRRKARRARRQ